MNKKKKIGLGYLLLIFILIMIFTSVYNHFNKSKFIEEYKQTCNITTNNEADFNNCIDLKLNVEEMNKPIIDIPQLLGNFVISLIIFFVLRFLLSVGSDLN